MQENRSYNESIFLLFLIPRHHSRSATVSILPSFFHTLSPSPLLQTKWNLYVDRQLISFQQTTLTIVHSVQRGVTTHTQKTTDLEEQQSTTEEQKRSEACTELDGSRAASKHSDIEKQPNDVIDCILKHCSHQHNKRG